MLTHHEHLVFTVYIFLSWPTFLKERGGKGNAHAPRSGSSKFMWTLFGDANHLGLG